MSPIENHEERLRALAEGYAAAGLPRTSQRRALIEVLAGRDDHPTVDQIYSAVAELLPEVSRTTVYRSLEVLTARGLLKRVEHPGSSVRYDANMEPHHHFLCTRCGALADLQAGAVSGAEALAFAGDPAATAEELTVYVRGVCAACAAAPAAG